MQRDSSTYCDEPANIEEYTAWRATCDLAAMQPEIDRILADNAFMAELQARIVPIIVEKEDFWHRYFFRWVFLPLALGAEHTISISSSEERWWRALRAGRFKLCDSTLEYGPTPPAFVKGMPACQ